MPDQTSRVYTIPDTANFLDSLAAAILQGNLPVAGGPAPDPLNLTRFTLLLPTRRSCRTMREAFLRVSGNNAILLPRIMPIGDIDEDLIELSNFGITPGNAESHIDIAPAITDLERRLVLSRLILKWSEATSGSAEKQGSDNNPVYTPAQASALASELISLMDAVETEQVDLSKIRSIVPEKYSDHWQKTLEFLSIVIEHWPLYLNERKLLSPMNRRNLLLQAESRRLSRELPTHPIIAAGATGSIPAAARLLDIVSKLPNGAVVLPGLDLTLDDTGWLAIDESHPEHPQYGLKKLLGSIGIERSDVTYVEGTEPDKNSASRLQLVSEVMRPAGTTEHWVEQISDPKRKAEWSGVLESFNYIETPTAQDEAEVVSLILRRAIETPGVRAALVTPDRILGRRVSVRLLKWGIMVDDSAGRPLVKTPPGTFFELLSDALEKNFAPAELLSLLKHPLTRLGYKAGEIRAATRAVELIALRQPLLGTGLDAIEIALDRMTRSYENKQIFHPVLGRLQKREWIRAKELIERLRTALDPLLQLAHSAEKREIPEFVRAKILVAEALARNHEGSFESLWQGEAGETLSIFLTNLLNDQIPGPQIAAHEYPQLYRGLIAGQALRDRTPVHPRLFIWGPFEARLQQADIVILGGLNEGVWPQLMEPDAWLNRPMRKELELPAIEELIGYSAHDFSQMLGTREVFLTRASKQDGVPTVPSRWILRLQTLMKGMDLEDKLLPSPEHPWLDWALLRDRVEREEILPPPNPKPPVKYRPRKLSVTQIEDWISNPYSIFARKILKLEPLAELGGDPNAALRGQIVHHALHVFSDRYPTNLPENTEDRLLEICQEILRKYQTHPRIAAFWLPRLERFAGWFAQSEELRRSNVVRVASETGGSLEFEAPAGLFTLTARADRIDLDDQGAVSIYDYKTGVLPARSEVLSGKKPQLSLEGAIAKSAGFEDLGAASLAALKYIRASGSEVPGEEIEILHDNLDELAADALNHLKKLVALFDVETTGYAALRRYGFDYRYDKYGHLARVKEWNAGEGGQT